MNEISATCNRPFHVVSVENAFREGLEYARVIVASDMPRRYPTALLFWRPVNEYWQIVPVADVSRVSNESHFKPNGAIISNSDDFQDRLLERVEIKLNGEIIWLAA